MANLIKQNNPQSNDNVTATLINNLFQQNQNTQNALMNIMRGSSGQPQIDPDDRLIKSMNLVKEIQGEQRVRTKDELDFGLKKQELVLKESARQDMLDREERAIIREDEKSENILGIGKIVLDKVIGNGVGNLLQDVMSVKTPKGKRRGRAEQPKNTEYDLSLLDDEL